MRKSKQKFTLTQTALILGALGAVGGTANAQWAVTNVNDPIYFGPTGIFTQVLGQMINSSKAATDQNTAMSEVNRKQTFQLQEDADQRGRLASGQLAVADKISKIRPTLEACALLSKGVSKSPSQRAASGGAGAAGGQSTPKSGGRTEDLRKATQNFNTLIDGPRSEKESLALIVETRSALGTCSQIDVNSGFGGCVGKSVGDFGGTNQLPASDISPISLFGNTSQSAKSDKQAEFASRSIPLQGKEVEVSKAYINNLVANGMPRTIDPKKMATNPTLMGQYRIYQQRIESSSKALRDILSLSLAPATAPDAQSVAGKHWANAESKYKTLFGYNAPKVPSMRDLLYYQTANDYMGVPDNVALNGDQLLMQLSERIAVSNYIAFRQLEATENVNVQLATININQLAPFNANNYLNELGKAENNKVSN